MKENYQKTTLDNGVRIVTERMENVRSVAVGIWVETGSRDETNREEGISHFLEHMMFKGTEKRSALEIAREIEQVGGYLNAYTSKEVTVYLAHLLDQHLPLAVDVLSDIVSHSKFAEEEIKKEKGVVLEEIAGSDDTPEDVNHNDFIAGIFPGHSLGKPVLGQKETVSAFGHDDIFTYWKNRYTTGRIVVTAAGMVDHDELVKMIEQKLELADGRNGKRVIPDAGIIEPRKFVRRKDIVQSHLILGSRGLNYSDPRRYAMLVMNTVLGAGMSSRLFQTVREQNGLAYSIYSFSEALSDSGLYGIYAGTEESQVQFAIDLINKELDRIMNVPLTDVELQRTKNQLKGAIILGLENTSARMNRLGKMEISLGEFVPLDVLIEKIDKVTSDEVSDIAKYLFSEEMLQTHLLPLEKE